MEITMKYEEYQDLVEKAENYKELYSKYLGLFSDASVAWSNGYEYDSWRDEQEI